MDSLVSTEWLASALGTPNLRVIDASFFLPDAGRDARAEHEAGHIPGAVFLDFDAVSDNGSPFPHMIPPAHQLASRLRALGIGDGDRIVVYDDSPLHSAARAWWLLRSFGARHVAILDGGLARWKAEGRPLETGAAPSGHGHFTPVLDETAVADKAHVGDLVHSSDHVIVDARPTARFAGDGPEPRPGVEPGHIPGSVSLPQGALFDGQGLWKRGDALRDAFEQVGVDLSKPMVATCGSGITAAVLVFGAHLLGKEDVKLYDGSWAEWGADPAMPKETGL